MKTPILTDDDKRILAVLHNQMQPITPYNLAKEVGLSVPTIVNRMRDHLKGFCMHDNSNSWWLTDDGKAYFEDNPELFVITASEVQKKAQRPRSAKPQKNPLPKSPKRTTHAAPTAENPSSQPETSAPIHTIPEGIPYDPSLYGKKRRSKFPYAGTTESERRHNLNSKKNLRNKK